MSLFTKKIAVWLFWLLDRMSAVLIDSTATATDRFNQRTFQILDSNVATAASISLNGDDGAAVWRCRGLDKNSNDTAALRARGDGFIAE
jgi:hypothetical protein